MAQTATLNRTLRGMKTTARNLEGPRSEKTALRIAAEETAVVEVIETLQDRKEISIDLREAAIEILIREFKSQHPTFELNRAIRPRYRDLQHPDRRKQLREQFNGTSDNWKDEFKDGLGPGVFTLACSATTLDGLSNILQGMFPDVSVQILDHNIDMADSSQTRVTFRVDECCDIDHLPDNLYITHRSDLEELGGEQ